MTETNETKITVLSEDSKQSIDKPFRRVDLNERKTDDAFATTIFTDRTNLVLVMCISQTVEDLTD